MAIKLAYIMSRFPKLSETFILREMNALKENGWDVSVYPLILENARVIHPEAKPWLGGLHHFPWLSKNVLLANVSEFGKRPWLYLASLLKVVFGNIQSPKFMVRATLLFPKAVLMAQDMKKNNIAHIHAHYATHPALVAWVINQFTGIPYSITVHAHDIYVDRSMLSPKLKNAVFIVAISMFNREFLAHHVGEWVSRKTHVIHCGIEIGVYRSSQSNASDGKFHIVSIGSLQPYKGMQYLIEAASVLKSRGMPIFCQIIGDGEERWNLEQLITRLGVDDVVELVGAKTQDEVAGLLRNAHCYVQPSVITPTGKMEGIPVALMEALSSSLPAVASDISGIPELIRNKETGYLAPQGDIQALADAIEYIYTHSDEAARVAQNGRELVHEEFEIKKNVAHLAELFSREISKA